MSSFFRAWYVFLALGFLTFVLVAFIGQPPFALSSSIALPTRMFHTIASNTRTIALSAADRRNVRLENNALSGQLDALETQNRQLEIELERLKDLLEVQETQSSGALLSAPVATVSSGNIIKELTLAKGSLLGVRENMPVTAPGGLVGIVTDVSARSSNVRAITDPQSRVGVTVRERGGQGIAVGMPGGLVRVVNYIEDEPIQVGDTIETSSRGGLFPRGMVLGTIVEIPSRDPNSLRIEFVVRPSVDVTTLLDVSLIEAK